MIESYTTIVSAYFKLEDSKATHEKYLEWMNNMLSIDNPMVIFCDEESVSTIAGFREKYVNKTKIIPTSFTDFYSFRYIEEFEKHLEKDTEVYVGHNVNLYMIWNEKSHFLKRAIELNFFNSEYFLWVDIGCFRRKEVMHNFNIWPNPEKMKIIDKSRVLLLTVQPFEESEILCTIKENLPDFQLTYRIGGTIFGGGKDVLLKWHKCYYEMLEYFIQIGRFIGKDQNIMSSLFLTERGICVSTYWDPKCHDKWFYLQDLLL